jgi:hypothetical protein
MGSDADWGKTAMGIVGVREINEVRGVLKRLSLQFSNR